MYGLTLLRWAVGFPACIGAGKWSILARQSTDRTSASRSMMPARSGRCSPTRTPGTDVAMESNGPRISLGAVGLGSKVSMWLGPPESQTRITAVFCAVLPCVAALARCCNRLGSDSPAKPARPVCTNQRREPTRIRSEAGGCSGLDQATPACSVSWHWLRGSEWAMTTLLLGREFRTIHSASVQAKLLVIFRTCQAILSAMLVVCNGPHLMYWSSEFFAAVFRGGAGSVCV